MNHRVLLAAVALSLPLMAAAQSWPVRPIRIIVATSPPGGADTVARTMAPLLTERLGQQVVVENRPGGESVIGAELAAKSVPDGYTFYLASGDTHALEQSLRAVDGVTGLMIRPHPVRSGVHSIDCMVQNIEGIEARIARAVTGSGELFRLERRQPTLENVFLSYISHEGGTIDTDAQREAA